jgi:hypothetical protein
MDIKPSADEIDIEAKRWFDRLGDPHMTREELGALDVWLLNPAHALAFERYAAPLDQKIAQDAMDLGIKMPKH